MNSNGTSKEQEEEKKVPENSIGIEWTDPSVFSDLKTLTDKQLDADVRYFICNYCKNWNIVKSEDLIDPTKPRKKEVKMANVHMELEKDFSLVWRRFSLNFGGYRNALIFLMNYYTKNSRNPS